MLLSGQKRSFLRFASTASLVSLFAFGSLLSAGCSAPRDARYAPKELRLSGSVVPPEILVGRKGNSGIYPLSASDDSDAMCCWTAMHARMLVAHTKQAQSLVANVYIPTVKWFEEHSQSLTVGLPNVHERKTFTSLRPGFHQLVFQPRGVHGAAPQTVTLDARVPFAPLGRKGPTYGVLLISIYFQ